MVSSARTVTFPGVVSPSITLFPLRRGPRDPCFQVGADGAIWRTSLLGSGSVTARINRAASNTVDCTAWGSGAEEFLEALPAMLGAQDDPWDFAPVNPIAADAPRRVPHLRLGRTDRVLEALIPAVLEQRVPGADAFRAWRLLVTKFGTHPPAPASRRGSSTAPTSIRDGPALSSIVRSGARRWNGSRHGRLPKPARR
jgi:3-methyladenine DNA glycosylase/8-oxoguanine DNA glycosylase